MCSACAVGAHRRKCKINVCVINYLSPCKCLGADAASSTRVFARFAERDMTNVLIVPPQSVLCENVFHQSLSFAHAKIIFALIIDRSDGRHCVCARTSECSGVRVFPGREPFFSAGKSESAFDAALLFLFPDAFITPECCKLRFIAGRATSISLHFAPRCQNLPFKNLNLHNWRGGNCWKNNEHEKCSAPAVRA